MSSSSTSTQSGPVMMAHGHVPRRYEFGHSSSPQQTPHQQQQQQQQRQRQLSGSSHGMESGSSTCLQTPYQDKQHNQQRQRFRTNSNSGNHSQYASKFSSSNSNIILQTRPTNQEQLYQTVPATTGVMPTTVSFVPMGASLQQSTDQYSMTTEASNRNMSAASSPIPSSVGYLQAPSSTTTTFYSGVKLAPPVHSASVIEYPQMDHAPLPQQQQQQQLHQHVKGLDLKTWYTIQVQPCNLIVPSSSSTSSGGNGGTTKSSSVTSIRRKPYRIYRRYEDMVDFADQLEEEFPGLMVAPRQSASASASATHDNNGSARSLVSKGDPSSITKILEGHDHGHGIAAGNYRPSVTKSFTPALPAFSRTATNSALTGVGASARGTGTSAVFSSSCHQQGNGGRGASLPRLKSRMVLFMTKAVCLQRKEELDRYLTELFALGPMMAQSRLVAEFFGIWKTDMEMHLSQEDRDPLALHSGVATVHPTKNSTVAEAVVDGAAGYYPVVTGQTRERIQSRGTMVQEDKEQEEQQEEVEVRTGNLAIQKDEAKKVNEGEETNDNNWDKDNNGIRTTPNKSFDPSSLPMVDATTSSASFSSSFQHPASVPMPSTSILSNGTTVLSTVDNKPGRLLIIHKASVASAAANLNTDTCNNNNIDCLVSPAPSPHPTTTMPKQPFSEDADSEMTSPTTSDEPSEFNDSAQDRASPTDDIATRTLKKFKSLRRTNTLTATNSSQPQPEQHQDQSVFGFQTTIASSSSTTPILSMASTQPAQPIKSKVMKRSKTTVFRTEVSMQPLSSRNVIPPWNRIPSAVTTATGSSTHSTSDSASNRNLPISPVSPVSPADGINSLLSHRTSSRLNSPSIEESDPFAQLGSFADPTTAFSSEERPQRPLRMTMTHSKTMSAIATLPSLDMWDEELQIASMTTTVLEPEIGGTTMTKSLSANHAVQTSSARREALLGSAFSGIGGRSMSVSLGTPTYLSTSSPTVTLPTTAPLIAPWNRVDPNAEMNTHLHSLIKISGQPSPSILGPSLSSFSSNNNNSPFVPVELGRSFLKKETVNASSQKKSNTMSARALLEYQRVVPVLSQPPSKVKSSSSSSSTTNPVNNPMPPKRKGMTHSISAPSGLVPKMVISTPIESLASVSGDRQDSASGGESSSQESKATRMQKRASLSSSSVLTSSATDMDRTSSAPEAFPPGTTLSSANTMTRKRYPRRESGPHSPSMATKQPVGILKKTNHQPPEQIIGGRKASLTVPSTGIFPVHSQALHSILSSGSSSSSPVPSPTPSPGPSSSSLITTFKIVMDADTIVALQVVEDRDFVLTLTDLQSRVRIKLLKSNIQLPERFELIWTSVASASGSSTAVLAASAAESGGSTPLKTDEDLHKAILGSRNHKVTLRCLL